MMFWHYILFFLSMEVTSENKKFVKHFLLEGPMPQKGPFFDEHSMKKNATGLVGQSMYLHCRVRNLGNKTVSWVRHRDVHLLTVGRYTYTSDQRFEAVHPQYTDEWNLKIKYPQRKDSGIYECQVSTTPPIGYQIRLVVKEAIIEIVGGRDLFIDKGSTINLTCLISFTPEPPPNIVWKHGTQEIDFDSPRGGISLITVKGTPNSTSRLLIQKANVNDSGEYSCNPSNTKPITAHVHILDGELPAAMQHGVGSTLLPIVPVITTAIIILTSFLIR